MSQHASLTALMRLMRDHVRQHVNVDRPWFRQCVTTKLFDLPVFLGEGVYQHFGAAPGAFR
ncbi:MAG TPA: hypothetical protein VKX25_22080 [Bryobacteraceae bacterium]|jgi:hypothetical protein|nr:hypothetical protein [Bryobacteraceae bacterium]